MAHVYMVYARLADNYTNEEDSTLLIGFSEDKKKANDLGRIFALEAGIPLPDGDCDISSIEKIPLECYWDDCRYHYVEDGAPEWEIDCYASFSIEEFELDKCYFDRFL